MKIVYEQEFKSKNPISSPQPTGNWLGPYLFLDWGVYKGDTMAILQDPKSGEVHMAYPGMVKFVGEAEHKTIHVSTEEEKMTMKSTDSYEE